MLFRKPKYKRKQTLVYYTFFATFSAYFCYNQPGSLYNSLNNHFDGKLDHAYFHIYYIFLYCGYAITNVFLPLFTGSLRDSIGDRLVFGILGLLIILGQIIFTLGVYHKMIPLMIFGRILIAWGVESFIPIQSSYVSKYYRERNLSTILSTVLYCSVLALAFSIFISRTIESTIGLTYTLLFGVILAKIGFIFLFISLMMDKNVQEIIDNNYMQQQTRIQNSDIILNSQNLDILQRQKLQLIIHLQDLRIFPKLFWYIVLFHTLFYCSILPLVNYSITLITEIFLTKHNIPVVKVGWGIVWYWVYGCSLLPLFGFISDKYGIKSYLAVTGSMILILGHVFYFWINKEIGVIIMGIAYSLQFSALWSCIVILIRPNALGKAYGILTACQNAGFAILPLIITYLNLHKEGQMLPHLVITSLAIGSFFITILILIEDCRNSWMLDKGYIAEPIVNKYISYDTNQGLQEHSSLIHEDLFPSQALNQSK